MKIPHFKLKYAQFVIVNCTSIKLRGKMPVFAVNLCERGVQFSHSVMSDSLQPRGLQHTRVFPVHHQCPELAQTHVHQVTDNIQPSHPLLSPSPPAFNLSQHQGLSNESVLPIRWPKYWSFSFSISPSNECLGLISFRIDWFDLFTSKGFSRVFSNTTVQKHQFFSAQLSSQSNSHIHT